MPLKDREARRRYEREYRIAYPVVGFVCRSNCRAADYKEVAEQLEVREVATITGPCSYCGLPCDRWRWDHAEPLALGGRNHISNIVACCRRCNMKKQGMPLAVWLERITSDPSMLTTPCQPTRAERIKARTNPVRLTSDERTSQ